MTQLDDDSLFYKNLYLKPELTEYLCLLAKPMRYAGDGDFRNMY